MEIRAMSLLNTAFKNTGPVALAAFIAISPFSNAFAQQSANGNAKVTPVAAVGNVSNPSIIWSKDAAQSAVDDGKNTHNVSIILLAGKDATDADLNYIANGYIQLLTKKGAVNPKCFIEDLRTGDKPLATTKAVALYGGNGYTSPDGASYFAPNSLVSYLKDVIDKANALQVTSAEKSR